MESKILTSEQEQNMLQYAFQLMSALTVVGPKQAGLLAQAGDIVLAVSNSMSGKAQNAKLAAKTECNGASCKAEETSETVVTN